MKKRMFVGFFIFTMSVFHLSIPSVVFGQSPAQRVFEKRKDSLFQRNDIRALFPDVLMIFTDPEHQIGLGPGVIEHFLNEPLFLKRYDSNINPQFLSLLTIDEDLRMLFTDGDFHTVLQDPAEIEKLVDLIPPGDDDDDDCPESKLLIVLGNHQSGEVGKPLAQPFVVDVLDQGGKPLKGTKVNFEVTAGGGRLAGQTRLRIVTNQHGRAQTTLTLGSRVGTNSVKASVDSILWTHTFTASATALGDSDVNRDGVVNSIDLSIVLSLITKPNSDIADVDADINRDKIVDYEDLGLVASALDATAAAPSLRALVQGGISATDVQMLLTQAKALPETTRADPAYQRGIAVLEQLLATLRQPKVVPKQTALLMNYPNPFNPETWIPYQLSEASDVTVVIYSMNGSRIRTLALGHRPAGLYQRKSRAAYWDGRNEFGERVASGLYFYTLTAGDFTATRKMLIRK